MHAPGTCRRRDKSNPHRMPQALCDKAWAAQGSIGPACSCGRTCLASLWAFLFLQPSSFRMYIIIHLMGSRPRYQMSDQIQATIT